MNKYLFIGTCTIAVFAVLVSAAPSAAGSAVGAGQPVTGWAWSSNIGWVSFSSSNSGAGSGAAYGVGISTTSPTSPGTFDGYAWSPNIGWVSFYDSDVSDCNSGTGSQAQVDLSGGGVAGWIRALAGQGRTDGWDGCIQLSGTNHTSPDTSGNSGVTFNPTTGQFNGYAWGGNVVGWLNFSPSLPVGGTGGTVTCSGCSTGPGTNPVTLTGTCDQNGVYTLPDTGGSVTYTFTMTNGIPPYSYTWASQDQNITGSSDPSNPASYTIVYPDNSSPNSIEKDYPVPTVSVTDSNNPPDTTGGPIPVCSDVTVAGNQTQAQSATVGLAQMIGSSATGPFLSTLQIPQGTTFAIDWTIPSGDTGCTASITTSQSSEPWDTYWSTSALGNETSPLLNMSTTAANAGNYTFGLTCTESDGKTQDSGSATLKVTGSKERETFNDTFKMRA